MKKTFLVICISFGLSGSLFCQATYATSDSIYVKLVTDALDDLKKGNCQPCLDKYEEAFKLSQKSILSRVRAATCAFDCKNEAKWRFLIDFVVQKDWGQTEGILKDEEGYPELTKYKDTELFKTALQQIKDMKKKAGYDEALAAELETIRRDDQALRQSLSKLKTDEERKDTWLKINTLDSINLLKIEKIFLKQGYPGKSKVGGSLGSTAFLVIQHSDLAYQEKYFPLLEKATNEGELEKSSLALLIDRIRMRKGQKQLYGSQLHSNGGDSKMEFHPIEDEENVNKRRAEMGLGSIEEYAKLFKIEYKFVKKD